MRAVILGIDGLDLGLIERYLEMLPTFRFLKEKGCLGKIRSVFPADSVPAWTTIFTGLNPSVHGIIRGKDYVESVEDFEKVRHFRVQGNTFWDKLSAHGKKCLVINPFLAYPAWPIDGVMVSGPAFVEGAISIFPPTVEIHYPETIGGYQAISSHSEVKRDLYTAQEHTKLLWEEFCKLGQLENYDLKFVTFTTLDRIQHYSWRYIDENDPMFAKDDDLSQIVLNTLVLFDSYMADIIKGLDDYDCLFVISDHGFGRRPFNLINLNELLRQHGFLKFNSAFKRSKATVLKQKVKNISLNVLSKLHLLDFVVSMVKGNKKLSQLKKSSHLIDTENSVCYVDSLFNGKKPYCGLTFGTRTKALPDAEIKETVDKLILFLKEQLPVKPLWVKTSTELYKGKFSGSYPDLCFELPSDYGIEFDFFGKIVTKSITHYRISGGHLGDGTFAAYSPKGKFKIPFSLEQFYDTVTTLYISDENTSGK